MYKKTNKTDSFKIPCLGCGELIEIFGISLSDWLKSDDPNKQYCGECNE